MKRKPMDWTFLIVIVLAVGAVILLKRAGQIGSAAAVDYLRGGARIVDVRTPEEFSGDHLEGAVNLPLGELADLAPKQITNKNEVILLHCLSGGRSMVAARQLRSMGYSNVHNLGSVGRARALQAKSKGGKS